MGLMTPFTPEVQSFMSLEGSLLSAFAMVLMLSLILSIFALGARLFNRLVLLNQAFDELSVRLFRVQWQQANSQSTLELDYEALQATFNRYFKSEEPDPNAMVKALLMIVTIQALKGKLDLSLALMDHLQLRFQEFRNEAEVSGVETVNSSKESERFGSPYSWSIEMEGGMEAGTVRPTPPEAVEQVKKQKAIALVLAELLAFGFEVEETGQEIVHQTGAAIRS